MFSSQSSNGIWLQELVVNDGLTQPAFQNEILLFRWYMTKCVDRADINLSSTEILGEILQVTCPCIIIYFENTRFTFFKNNCFQCFKMIVTVRNALPEIFEERVTSLARHSIDTFSSYSKDVQSISNQRVHPELFERVCLILILIRLSIIVFA